MKYLSILIIMLAGLFIFATAGQNLSGTYTMSNQGINITLVLIQSADNQLSGTLSSTTGARFQITGMLQDGVGVGVCRSEAGGVYFEAHLQGNELLFVMIQPGPDNQPDYNQARQLRFTRQSTNHFPPPPGATPGKNVPNRTYSPPPAAAPATPAPAPAAVPGGSIGNPNWGFNFQAPSGWKHQASAQGVILGHDSIAGMILVLPHLLRGAQEVQAQLQQGMDETELQLRLTSGLQAVGQNAWAGDYSGMYQGQSVLARGVGTASPHGGGAFIIALTTPAKYGPQLRAAAEAITGSMRYFPVDVSDLVAHFAGTWAHTTGYRTDWITLHPDGTYKNQYEAGYSGDLTDGAGTQTGQWGATGTSRSTARWTIRGTRKQGIIFVTFPDGTVTELQYRVYVEKGRTYWREYVINGRLYSKQNN